MLTYQELIEQTFDFPTQEFKVEDSNLFFNDVDLMSIIQKYGTPLKISYLPKIGQQIAKAKKLFADAMQKHEYTGQYTYCYCTKSSHFSFIMDEVLRHDTHIETSSAYDIAIVRKLFQKGSIDTSKFIVCNGFKRPLYTQYISELINEGFENCIPVLDNLNEIDEYDRMVTDKKMKLGIRIAAAEEPNFQFYTSRLGIRYSDVDELYKSRIKDSDKFSLKMLHFFINTGIKDTAYYWSELNRFIETYCKLKKICPELDSIDIGGGFPIKTSIHFDYDFEWMVDQIIENIKWYCNDYGVDCPNIFTEFGSFTVGESGATIYSVLDQKLQNDTELWYMIDGSFITQIPDSWALNERFILMSINNWGKPYRRVNLGGLTCDSMDYYNSETHSSVVFLPKIKKNEPQYLGFFHTGAYQESIGGYGGIQHCLIPAPKHVIIEKDENGNLSDKLFRDEQTSDYMLEILGY